MVGRFDVGALDQADVDASLHEPLQVAWRAAEVGLCRGSEPAGQALAGDGLDAGEHGVGTAVIFRPGLDAPAGQGMAGVNAANRGGSGRPSEARITLCPG